MDTSETYIKMCKKAEKIQAIGTKLPKAHSANLWDSESNMMVTSLGEFWVFDTWIPRQDQLQEMMGLSDRQLMKQFRDFLWWITGVPQAKYPGGVYDNLSMPYGVFLPSFDQLWLAFVMKEKYGKVWNGEDWIKEE